MYILLKLIYGQYTANWDNWVNPSTGFSFAQYGYWLEPPSGLFFFVAIKTIFPHFLCGHWNGKFNKSFQRGTDSNKALLKVQSTF